MMTPLDIQTKKFSNSAFGYKKSEVDNFMMDLLAEYETLYKTVGDSKEKIDSLSKMIESYKSMEDTMKNTLLVAQQSAEQLSKSAKAEAEAILAEANQNSNEIIAEANKQMDVLTLEYEELKKEIKRFVLKSKAEFEIQIKNLDTMDL